MNPGLRILTLGAAVLLAAPLASAQRPRRAEPEEALSRNAPEILKGFRETVKASRRSTVRLHVGEDEVALGTIVTPDGKVLTKASEIDGELRCQLPDGREVAARLIAKDTDWDVALVQVDAKDLTVIRWAPDSALIPGRLLLSTGVDEDPLAFGVVSSTPRRVRGGSGYLGVTLGAGPDGAHITTVSEDSAAAAAGMKDGDVVIRVGDHEITDRNDLIRAIQERDSGETIELEVRRGDEVHELSATLGSRSTGNPRPGRGGRRNGSIEGEQSQVRVGFKEALQHDSVLRPQDCGGPLIGLDGRAVALNIARAGRISTYAIPAREAIRLVTRLRGDGGAD